MSACMPTAPTNPRALPSGPSCDPAAPAASPRPGSQGWASRPGERLTRQPRRPRGWVATAAILGLFSALQLAGTAQAQSPRATPPADSAAPRTILGQPPGYLNDTVVRIEVAVTDGAESTRSLGARRAGTGVLIAPDTVLTIGYLLIEAEDVNLVTPDGRRIPGSVAGYDHESGFGLVRSVVPLPGRPLELGDSDTIKELQKVATLGHGEPEATELLVVSRKTFTGSWEYVLDSAIFTFPPVNNWSGAALVDNSGRLIGIGSLIVNDAATSRPGVPGNVYVPVNLLKPILKDLLATGRRGGPVQPWLGLTTEVVQGNLMVSRVSKGGPAELAGIVAGDIIVGIDGDKVTNQTDFYKHVWKQGPAGVTVSLRVLQSGDVRNVAVRTIDRTDLLRKPRGV